MMAFALLIKAENNISIFLDIYFDYTYTAFYKKISLRFNVKFNLNKINNVSN